MFTYLLFFLLLVPIVFYYLNINPFEKKNVILDNEIDNDNSLLELESNINELKNLNYYIDNGVPNSSSL